VVLKQPASKIGDLPHVATRACTYATNPTFKVGKQSELSKSRERSVGVSRDELLPRLKPEVLASELPGRQVLE
jgi:hypothetical protein